MNAIASHRWLLLLLASLIGLPLLADFASAAESSVLLQASSFYELVADRARMIQISLVIVALGCALLWWRR